MQKSFNHLIISFISSSPQKFGGGGRKSAMLILRKSRNPTSRPGYPTIAPEADTRSSFASSSEICARRAPAAVDEPQHGLAQADDVARALRAPPQPCPRRTAESSWWPSSTKPRIGTMSPNSLRDLHRRAPRCASWSSRRTASTSGIWSQRAPRCSRMHHEITQVGRRRRARAAVAAAAA